MVFSRTTRGKKKEIVCVIWWGLNNRKKNVLSFLPLLWKVFSHFVWTNHDLSIWLHPPILSSEKIEIIPKSKRKKKRIISFSIFLHRLMHWARLNVLLKEMGSMSLKHKLLFKRPLQIEGVGFVLHYLLLAKCFLFNETIQEELNFSLKWYAYRCTIIYANWFYRKDKL